MMTKPLVRPKPLPGVYDRMFWDHIDKRELRLQACSACSRLRYPPAPVCPNCLDERYEWQAMSGRGRVLAWTVFHRQYFPELPVPYTVASIALEEGPMLIGNLVNAPEGSPRVDLPVRLAFEEVHSPEGNWLIPQWEPVDRQADPGPAAA